MHVTSSSGLVTSRLKADELRVPTPRPRLFPVVGPGFDSIPWAASMKKRTILIASETYFSFSVFMCFFTFIGCENVPIFERHCAVEIPIVT